MNRIRFCFSLVKFRRRERIIKRTDICTIPSEWLVRNVTEGLPSTFFAEHRMQNAVREKARSMLPRGALQIAIGKRSFGIRLIGSSCDPRIDGRRGRFVLRDSKYKQTEDEKLACAWDGFCRPVSCAIRLFHAMSV